MKRIISGSIVFAIGIVLGACGDSPGTPPGPAASTQERVKQDIKAAGQNLKEAGDAVAQQADPIIEKAKLETKDAVHRAAEKLANDTAGTQLPATSSPATAP